MTQIGQTIRHAARGPVVASPDAWGLCDSLFTGTETESGTTLTGTHDTLPPVAFAGTDTVPVEVSSATFESYLPAFSAVLSHFQVRAVEPTKRRRAY